MITSFISTPSLHQNYDAPSIFKPVFLFLYTMSEIQIIQFPTKYGSMFCLPHDIAFVDSLKAGKLFEEEILDQLQPYIKGDGDILDIGAHIGCHTVFYNAIRNETQKLFCFEPQSVIHKILELNVKGIPNLELFQVAAGPYEDTLYLDNDFTKDHYPESLKVDYKSQIAMNFGGLGVTYTAGGEPVKMVKLDAFLKHKTKKVHFIKIDTEGAENGILFGLGEILFRDRPILFVEDNQDKNRDSEFSKKEPMISGFSYFRLLKHLGYSDPIEFPGKNNLFVHPSSNKS